MAVRVVRWGIRRLSEAAFLRLGVLLVALAGFSVSDVHALTLIVCPASSDGVNCDGSGFFADYHALAPGAELAGFVWMSVDMDQRPGCNPLSGADVRWRKYGEKVGMYCARALAGWGAWDIPPAIACPEGETLTGGYCVAGPPAPVVVSIPQTSGHYLVDSAFVRLVAIVFGVLVVLVPVAWGVRR